MAALLDAFPGQPLDFYGALRSATYDGQIRAWIRDEVVRGDLSAEDANMTELSRRLINRRGPQCMTATAMSGMLMWCAHALHACRHLSMRLHQMVSHLPQKLACPRCS
jgi:hypothetical protein